jgi:hypothetical protein
MGHGRHVSGSSYPTPEAPAPVADYNVKTNPELNPDCSCNYFAAGTYNGKSYYRRGDGGWFIWWDGIHENWTISTMLGIMIPAWRSPKEQIIDIYDPYGGYAGDAIVYAGPH